VKKGDKFLTQDRKLCFKKKNTVKSLKGRRLGFRDQNCRGGSEKFGWGHLTEGPMGGNEEDRNLERIRAIS